MSEFSGHQKARLVVIFALGFYAIPSQIILMREFMLVFGGNELIIGLFLAIWMLLTAGGSYAAKWLKLPDPVIPYYSVFLAWLPVLLLYLIDLLRNRIFLPGIEPGVFPVLLASVLLLLPFCFLSGLLFAGVAGQLNRPGKEHLTDKAYGIESIGSMAGGLLFSLVLVYLYDNFRSAGIIAWLGSAVVLYFWNDRLGKPITIIMSILLLALAVFTLLTGSRFPRHFLFPNQELLEIRDTPYGNLAVTGTSGQLNVFENNQLLFSTDNPLASEEAVHFAMVQHSSPRRVLLVSGGIAGLTEEILKYGSVEVLDYIEIDPVIMELGKKYTHFLSDKKINIIAIDPRIYLRKTDRKYDAVIVYLPPPFSFQINRYYTTEFMNSVKKCLDARGIFTFSLPLTANYLDDSSLKLYSSLFNTCKSVFLHVSLFPGQSCTFVASEPEIKKNITQLIEYKNINTDYVNSYYINEAEMDRRSRSITSQLQPGEANNTDFNPVAVSNFYQYWLNRFQIEFSSFKWVSVLITVLIIIGLTIASPAYSGMFAAGFTASALQVILILSFQIVYGYIYRSIGLFTAVFMTGLAMGALIRKRFTWCGTSMGLVYLQLILAVFSVLVPGLIQLSASLIHLPFGVHLLYLASTWLISFTTGLVFTQSVRATAKSRREDIPAVYGADLAGASLGAFTTTLLLIPLAGIKAAPFLAGSLNLIVAGIMIFRLKRIFYA